MYELAGETFLTRPHHATTIRSAGRFGSVGDGLPAPTEQIASSLRPAKTAVLSHRSARRDPVQLRPANGPALSPSAP